MKITVYYEDKHHPTILDVPDDECEIWVEDDYQRRLAAAEDKSTVTRRTAQEIMNEDYNEPTFNSCQRETRRHVSLDALDPKGEKISDGTDLLEDLIEQEDIKVIRSAIQKLKPRQQLLLYQIFQEGLKQNDIAAREGVSVCAIAEQKQVIFAALKKILLTFC